MSDRYAPPTCSTADSGYRIVIPSRGRPFFMERVLSVFPEAVVCVDEAEEADYRPVVGEKLWLHPRLPGIAYIRNWILDQTPERVCVQADDDFEYAMSLVGRKFRRITNGSNVMQIIANGVQLLYDLDQGVMCWNCVSPNPLMYHNSKPFRFVAPVFGLFCIKDRCIRFDETLSGGDDIELTMRALLKCRIVLQDSRFFFASGQAFGDAGGMTGIRTGDAESVGRAEVQRRWRGYLNMGASKATGGEGLSITTLRQSPLAVTR